MAYVKIKFGKALWVTEADSPGMYSIGYLLTDDITYGSKRIEWILDNRYTHTSSNRTFMEKYNDMIIVGDLFTDDSNEAALWAPTSAIIDLLIRWDEVCNTNPDAVIVYYEDEKFRIESQKNDHNAKQDSSAGEKVLK